VPTVSNPSAAPAGRSALFGRRRRAEQFAQLLDGDASQPALVATRNDPHLAPLIELATALRSVPLGPTPDFRSTLRQRLVAVAAVQGVGEVSLPAAVRAPAATPSLPRRINEWAEGWRVRPRFIAATAAASAVVLVGGVGLAGSRSLPGQPLYGVKRGTERVQLAMAGSTEAKGERHLQFARTRLHEVAAMVKSPEAISVRPAHGPLVASGALGGSLSARVISTLHDMDAETTAGTKDLTTAFARSHDSHPLNVLATFAAKQQNSLNAVLPALPADAAARAAASLALIQRVDTRAHALLTAPSCTAACSSGATVPGPAPTPAPGDELGATPCSCAATNDSSGSDSQGSTNNGPTPAPSPTGTPKPDNNQPAPSKPSPSPSPTPTTLQGQIGSILSNLPLPVTPPPLPLPDLPPVPVPVPTIHLPH
jgi:hypothetical protein